MKKNLFTILLVLMALIAPVVFAEETEETNAGSLPGDTMYGLDKAMDSLSLAFTFGNEAKAKKELRIAEERLAELQQLAAEGKVEEAKEAKEEHQKLLVKVKSRIEKIEEDDSLEQYEKELEFEAKIREQKEKALKIEIKGDLNPEAQAALEQLIAALGDDVEEVEIKIKNKQEETKIKVEQEHGEEELESLEGPYWERKAMNEQIRAEEEIVKAAKKIDEFEEKIAALMQKYNSESWKSMISESCMNFFDGCNSCKRVESGEAACTMMACSEYAKPECKDKDDDDSDDDSGSSSSSGGKNPDMNNQITGQVTNELDKGKQGSDDSDDIDEDEDYTEFEDKDEYDDEIMDDYDLKIPEYAEKDIESSKKYLEDAKAALSTSEEKETEGDYEAAYAYARYAKKLAQRAMSGNYLTFTETQKEAYEKEKEEREHSEEVDCTSDSDCDSDEFCDSGECEDLEDKDEEEYDDECKEDSDCKAEEICIDEECELKNIPMPECFEDSDCDSDEFCDENECKELDEDNSDDDEDDE